MQNNASTKTDHCVACLEPIASGAKKCRWCGTMQPGNKEIKGAKDGAPDTESARQKKIFEARKQLYLQWKEEQELLSDGLRKKMKLLRTWHDHAWIEKVIAWSASILTGAFVGHLLWLLQEKIPESVSAIPALSGWLQWVLPAGVGLFVLSKLVRPATKLIDAYEDHWTTHLYDMRGLELKVAHQNMRLKERQEITAAKATEAAAEAPAPAEPKRAFPTLEELAKNAPQQSNDA